MSVSTESPEIDLAHLRTWIGREEVAVDVVSDDLARKFHATLDMPGEAPSVGEAAPGLIHFCLAPQIAPTAQLGPDGHPRRGGFLPPVPLPRRMWAGGRLTFSRPIRVGDCICRTSRIGDVAAKTGRSGALVFVKVEHTLDVQGEAAVEEVHDIVYRGLAATSAATPAPAEVSPNRRRIDVSPTLLFRYSALTFNGHRIHYDLKAIRGSSFMGRCKRLCCCIMRPRFEASCRAASTIATNRRCSTTRPSGSMPRKQRRD